MGKKITGKVFGGIAAFVMIFSMISTTVLAGYIDDADYTLYLDCGIDGNGVVKVKKDNQIGDDITATVREAGLTYENDKWIMNDFHFTTTAENAIEVGSDITFVIKDKNEITSTNTNSNKEKGSKGFADNGQFTINISAEKNSSLTVKSGDSDDDTSEGIQCTILNIKGEEGSKLTVIGGDGKYGAKGISGNQISISGDITVDVTAGDSNWDSVGISALGLGNLDGVVKIDGGNVIAKGGKAEEGYSYGIFNDTYNGYYRSRFIMNGGNLTASGQTMAINSDAIRIDESLTVDGDISSSEEVKITSPQLEPEPEEPSHPDVPYIPVESTATIAGLSGEGNDVSVTVNNGAVSVSDISKDMINEIASNETNGNAIVLDVSKVEGGSKNDSKVTLTKETMSNIAEALTSADNNKENLVVKTSAATVTIDATAFSAVVSQASAEDIQIVVENKVNENLNDSQQAAVKDIASAEGKEVAQTFEAYIVSGGTKISDLKGGEITIGKLDYAIPVGRDPKKYTVYAITEDGELVECETWVEDGVILFSTDSLSDYVLVYDLS